MRVGPRALQVLVQQPAHDRDHRSRPTATRSARCSRSRWEGTDVDGSVEQYQYVLDPAVSSWKIADDTFFTFSVIDTIVDQGDTTVVVDTGWHEFRVRALDNSNCWEIDYENDPHLASRNANSGLERHTSRRDPPGGTITHGMD